LRTDASEQALVEQRLREHRQLARVERHGRAAVVVGSERDVLVADQVTA
jgi:uncharacterized Ntn-hydrolase superfamily protein